MLCLQARLKKLLTVPQPCHLSLTLGSQGEREGVWTSSPGNAWGWESELFWDCLHLESSWSLVPEKHPHVGNSSELFTVGVFLHLLQLFLLLGWKKNLLVISHNLWGSAFDSPTEKRDKEAQRGAHGQLLVGRKCGSQHWPPGVRDGPFASICQGAIAPWTMAVLFQALIPASLGNTGQSMH